MMILEELLRLILCCPNQISKFRYLESILLGLISGKDVFQAR